MLENREFERKIVHLIVGILIIILVYFNIIDEFAIAVIFLIGVLISLLCLKIKVPIISWFLKRYDKREGLHGEIMLSFFAGILISLILFEKRIALAAIIILTLGDFFSNIIGKRYGKHYISKNRSYEGSAAGFIAGFLGALIFVNLLSAILGSFFGMLAEALNLKIDDNIIIPIVAGSVMSLL